MSQYKKGRRAEYYIKNKLEDFGHKVYRLAGSKPFDLISFFGGMVFTHEVKSGEWTTDDVNHLIDESKQIEGKYVTVSPVFWYKEDGKWTKFLFTEQKKIFLNFLP